MDPIRTQVSPIQVGLGVGYTVASRSRGDVAVHMGYVRLEDCSDARSVPDTRRADDGVLGGSQAQELGDDGIPILRELLHSRAQAILIVASTANPALVRFARVPEVVYAYVEGHHLGAAEVSSHRLVVAQGVEQFGARLAALTQVDNVDSSACVGLDVGRVTLNVATASAHTNGQGVAEGHVVPGSGDGGNRRGLLASGRLLLSSRSARMPLRDRRWPMRCGVPDVIVGPVRALFPGDGARRQARQ